MSNQSFIPESVIKGDKKICIVGAGGFGREVLCCISDIFESQNQSLLNKIVFMVSDEYFQQDYIMNIPVIKQSDFNASEYLIVVAVGDPISRKNIVESFYNNATYMTVIHPSATISSWVEVGEGSIITAGVVMTCNIKIGKHCQLNLLSTIGHDCTLGDFVTIAPGANISGNCFLGNQIYLGTNSCVRERLKITDNVTIGMGGVVIKNIVEEGIYVGNPLKKLEKK